MSHIKSYSKEIDGSHFLFTKGPKGKEIQIGGPYKSSSEATFMSKDASKNVGEGSIAKYKQHLKALYHMSHERRPQISKASPPIPKHKPPKPAPPTPKHKPPKPKGKGRIDNPSEEDIKKVNNVLAKKHKTQNFNSLTPKQIDYGNQLLNNPEELQKAYNDTVKGYNIGGLISGALGTPPGAAPVPQGTSPGQGTPKKGPSPAAVQDALLKKKADEKKRIDLAGKPGMSKDASKNVGEGSIAKYKQHLTTPPKMARKGGKISMRDGGSVSKNYSNTCKTDLTVDV